ncbi:MAG: hypothetical protein ACE5I1_26995 [bacterium]
MISNISLSLPGDLGKKLAQEAKSEQLSIEGYILQLIKQSILYSDARREVSKKLESRSKLPAAAILNKIPDRPPLEGDEII